MQGLRRKGSNPDLPLSSPHKQASFPTPSRRYISCRINRHRVVAFTAFLLFVLYETFYTSEDSRFNVARLRGGPCLKELTPPRAAWPAVFEFPEGLTPYEGLYAPIRRGYHGHMDHGEPPTVPPDEELMECLTTWIAEGIRCENATAPPKTLAVVWTYANGSDPIHQQAYKSSLHDSDVPPPNALAPRGGAVLREFDELRFSLRSVLTNFRESAKEFVIIAPEYPWPGCKQRKYWRLGALPQFLRRTPLLDWRDRHVGLRVEHHSHLFGNLADRPNFNSLAIESRLPHIAEEEVGDSFIYMNDDIFFTSKMTAADFHSQFSGPVFRLQPDILISPNRAKNGEWAALHHTNDLLNYRFGSRARPYLTHTAKTLSTPMLREIAIIWHKELEQTSRHRHRSVSPKYADVSLTMLLTHYMVERWRETLLWSFIVGSIGGDDDQWTEDQTRQAWLKLGGDPSLREYTSKRGHRDLLEEMNQDVGARQTTYVYTSYDGYPYSGMGRSGFKSFPDFSIDENQQRGQHIASRCLLSLPTCFPTSERTATGIFKNVAFKHPTCGDCIISTLATQSGFRGLKAFLPAASRKFPIKARTASHSEPHHTSHHDTETEPRLPLTKDWTTTDFTLRGAPAGVGPVRQWVVQALLRYEFVIGETPSEFIRLETPIQSNATLSRADAKVNTPEEVAMTCVNDDVRWQPEVIATLLQEWMERRWPQKAAWEEQSSYHY